MPDSSSFNIKPGYTTVLGVSRHIQNLVDQLLGRTGTWTMTSLDTRNVHLLTVLLLDQPNLVFLDLLWNDSILFAEQIRHWYILVRGIS